MFCWTEVLESAVLCWRVVLSGTRMHRLRVNHLGAAA